MRIPGSLASARIKSKHRILPQPLPTEGEVDPQSGSGEGAIQARREAALHTPQKCKAPIPPDRRFETAKAVRVMIKAELALRLSCAPEALMPITAGTPPPIITIHPTRHAEPASPAIRRRNPWSAAPTQPAPTTPNLAHRSCPTSGATQQPSAVFLVFQRIPADSSAR